jgi:cytochrome c55X
MNWLWRVAAVAATAAACAGPAQAQTPVEPTPDAGRKIYTSYCARCHGINLVVGSSAYFDLRTFPADEKDRFLTSVTNGKRQMPAWGGIVRPDQMEAIWAYLGAVNGWPRAPDAPNVASASGALSVEAPEKHADR